MTRLVRTISATSVAVLLAGAIGAAPALADGKSPAPGPAISVPDNATDLPAEALPLFLPSCVAATRVDATTAPVAALADQLRAVATLPQVMDNVRNWIIGLISGLATLFVTVGGLRYLMAGDEGEVMKAKAALRSAAAGYALAALAPVLVDILKSLVGTA